MCKNSRTFAQTFCECAMNTSKSFNEYIRQAIVKNWNQNALTDYQGQTLQFHDVARKIGKLHILFEQSGVKPGDKVALCGRNQSHWGAAFFAITTGHLCGRTALAGHHKTRMSTPSYTSCDTTGT